MINKIISNSKNIFIIILLIIISILFFKNYSIEKQFKENQVILTDSLYDYKNKYGELYKEKQVYIIDKDNLERINKELYDEIKRLKDNPIIVTKIETIVKIDSVYMESNIEIDSLTKNKINFYNYRDNYLSMDVSHILENDIGKLSINNINMMANLSYSIIENKKTNQLSIIAKTDNPYLSITDINGGFIGLDDSKTLKRHFAKKTKWALSINAGYGVVYNVPNNNFVFGPTLSIGISRNLIQW